MKGLKRFAWSDPLVKCIIEESGGHIMSDGLAEDIVKSEATSKFLLTRYLADKYDFYVTDAS